MKWLISALCVLVIPFILASCSAAEPAQAVDAPEAPSSKASDASVPVSVSSAESPEASVDGSESSDEDMSDEPEVYIPMDGMTIEQVAEAYFEQHYIAYSSLRHIDTSAILDMKKQANINMLDWSEMLIMRRRLIKENDFCYVETEMLPYAIEYDSEAEDDRMDFWHRRNANLGDAVLHFRIKGEAGKAYPPIMAMNSQHSMFFEKIDGVWKVTMHYFPGSIRKFTRAGNIAVLDEDEMLESLMDEFEPQSFSEPPEIPNNAVLYDADAAVSYALDYTEHENPDFYRIIDWVGNCANFVSQCVSEGFGGGAESMTADWNGGDGGTPAWENVNYFWSSFTGSERLAGQILAGAWELENGDIIQTQIASTTEEERFTHMLIVTDEKKLMLSQNTPACFVYYSDLVNLNTRMVRPVFLAK